ncbi:hypothetical protein [Gillisia sp. JM1]|uniref:hypothetical protein n=1 Tax=Gillisia sp. JM1 TaxID=1283286 RepID=UPI0003F900AB|nr:hypothetical protein [Gillisia sp. JM1]
MKTGQFILLLCIGVLLASFITNPDREKHAENATEMLFQLNKEEDNYGILGGLISTFSKETVKANIKIKNYYLFSKSYIYSPSRDKRLDLGLGIFGQVVPLSHSEEIESFQKLPAKSTSSKINESSGVVEKPNNSKMEILNENKKPSHESEEAMESLLNGREVENRENPSGYYDN